MLTPEPRACDATSLVGTSRVTVVSWMGGTRRLVLLLLLSAAMESHGELHRRDRKIWFSLNEIRIN